LLHAAHIAEFLEGNSTGDREEVDEEEEDDAGEDDAVGSANPIHIVSPFTLRLDWWGDKAIKTWAGSMDVRKIALAMSHSIDPENSDPFNDCRIAYDPRPECLEMSGRRNQPKKHKREPFYFDARKSMNSNTIDVGFSTNKIKMESLACPSVEFLALIGLQRCRPRPASFPRKFDYFTWGFPYDVALLSAIVAGILQEPTSRGYRFENWNRTGKIRAYRSAYPINKEGE
jgi:CRISPR-associated protein Csb3